MKRTEIAAHRRSQRTGISNEFRGVFIKIARSLSSSLQIYRGGKNFFERKDGDLGRKKVIEVCVPPDGRNVRSCVPDPQPLVIEGHTVVALVGVRPREIAFSSSGGAT